MQILGIDKLRLMTRSALSLHTLTLNALPILRRRRLLALALLADHILTLLAHLK